MTTILDTIIKVLLDLRGQSIKALPSLLSTLVVLYLTQHAVQIDLKIAEQIVKCVIKSTSLQHTAAKN